MKKGDIVRMTEGFKTDLLSPCYYNDEGFLIHVGRCQIYDDTCLSCSSDHVEEFGNCFGIVDQIYEDGFVDVRWQPSNLRYQYDPKYLNIIDSPIKNVWFVYLVKCKDKTIYTGITNVLNKRIEQHNNGKGAKYTRSRGPVTLVRFHVCRKKSDALKLEYKIKQLPKEKKLKYVRD
jgi:putative endonuclease